MRFGRRHALPQGTLHVVLKKQAGNRQLVWKVQRRSQEITDCDIELPAQKLSLNQLANCRMRKLGDRIRSQTRQPPKVMQEAAKSVGFGSRGIDDLRPRKLLG